MTIKSKIFALMYLFISSVTVLVMLTTSFELFDEKYFPSFLLAQKYAFPLIISTMAIIYLVFFEPERLEIKKTITIMKIVMIVTLGLFSFYCTTIDSKAVSLATICLYVVQWIALLGMTVLFFLPWKKK